MVLTKTTAKFSLKLKRSSFSPISLTLCFKWKGQSVATRRSWKPIRRVQAQNFCYKFLFLLAFCTE